MSDPPAFAPRRSVPRRWWVYVVRRRDGALYTGIATDVRRRIGEHARERGKGAKSLRGRGPLSLAFQRVVGSRGVALRVECAIKRLPKAHKEALLAEGTVVDRLIRLARAGRPRGRCRADPARHLLSGKFQAGVSIPRGAVRR